MPGRIMSAEGSAQERQVFALQSVSGSKAAAAPPNRGAAVSFKVRQRGTPSRQAPFRRACRRGERGLMVFQLGYRLFGRICGHSQFRNASFQRICWLFRLKGYIGRSIVRQRLGRERLRDHFRALLPQRDESCGSDQKNARVQKKSNLTVRCCLGSINPRPSEPLTRRYVAGRFYAAKKRFEA